MKASEVIEINKKQNKTTNNNKKISKLFTLDEIIKEIYNNWNFLFFKRKTNKHIDNLLYVSLLLYWNDAFL